MVPFSIYISLGLHCIIIVRCIPSVSVYLIDMSVSTGVDIIWKKNGCELLQACAD